MATPSELLRPTDTFVRRHLGASDADVRTMLDAIGAPTLEALVGETVPEGIRLRGGLDIGPQRGETETLAELQRMARRNEVRRSFIGMGYADTITPGVILRNILQNPGWYTAYTPYQAEIAQGRLEALLNFQTMVADLTGLAMCNASLLDEGTAAAEAMAMSHRALRGKRNRFLVADDCHPQTIAILQTRAEGLGIEVEVVASDALRADEETCGVLLQYPNTYGAVLDPTAAIEAAHAVGAHAVVATDLLAMTLLKPPGEFGADIVVGSSQRFGVPLGYGGPHAAFMATSDAHKRHLPGRVIGVSKDIHGAMALRMAMQTREQHIRRERATSNICTAQVLLAVIAGAYGVYHGPQGLTQIAQRVHTATAVLAAGLRAAGHEVETAAAFDTLSVKVRGGAASLKARCDAEGINLRPLDDARVGVALDETVNTDDLRALLRVFGADIDLDAIDFEGAVAIPKELQRSSPFMTHPVFHQHHGEHEMLRYLKRLENKDISLTHSMIALGSCTMKLNATSEMDPVTWPEFGKLHPFVPLEQAQGYKAMFDRLEAWLADITGFDAVSLQPNAGSQGEYTGLMVIRAYHRSRGDTQRNVCLIPVSAHGTNPASAVMAGMTVVVVACDEAGNIDVNDLRAKAAKHAEKLAAVMVTYPSTHGVFETSISEICTIVHDHGGQVYLDGANMNAQVGLCRPGDYGADVCHLNLHKTFCIPHGGGGPGMGPIGVVSHLAPFLPGHPVVDIGGPQSIGPVSAAPYGSASILPISYMYIAMMGSEGLTEATRHAILCANYMAKRIGEHYPILYQGASGRVAHEFIVDLRPFKATAGIEAEDVAKRLMDYGFHAPTMSFPVTGTLMIEPTESESKAELDRFCDTMIAIRNEIAEIEAGRWPKDDNPLKNAPHTANAVMADAWEHPYSREQAAFGLPWVRIAKIWPAVGRIDNAFGDRHLICSCPPMDAYEAAQPG